MTHVVEAVDCTTPQTVVGVISQIIDLGLQTQEDAKFVNKDDERQWLRTLLMVVATMKKVMRPRSRVTNLGNNKVVKKRWSKANPSK